MALDVWDFERRFRIWRSSRDPIPGSEYFSMPRYRNRVLPSSPGVGGGGRRALTDPQAPKRGSTARRERHGRAHDRAAPHFGAGSGLASARTAPYPSVDGRFVKSLTISLCSDPYRPMLEVPAYEVGVPGADLIPSCPRSGRSAVS